MFQIVFNTLSAAEISRIPTDLQLEVLADLRILPEDLEELAPERFGKIERDGKTLYRCRANDFRLYFERVPEGILIHRVLHKNTLRDFLFRSNMPLMEEDRTLGEKAGFWKLIEEGEKSRKS